MVLLITDRCDDHRTIPGGNSKTGGKAHVVWMVELDMCWAGSGGDLERGQDGAGCDQRIIDSDRLRGGLAVVDDQRNYRTGTGVNVGVGCDVGCFSFGHIEL